MKNLLTAMIVLGTMTKYNVEPMKPISVYPSVYDSEGKYRGNLDPNKYAAESIYNRHGQYGSKYSSESINNVSRFVRRLK